MWAKLADHFLRKIIKNGELRITWPDGSEAKYGDRVGIFSAIHIHDPALARKLVLNPELAIGEAYMDETLTIAEGDLAGFMTLVATNARDHGVGHMKTAATGARTILRQIAQNNPLPVARKNVEIHYDLSTDMYELFLDKDLQYTCGYFKDPGMTLEESQDAKKAHIARKLCLKPGMRVLDIGCGWGGMALTLARDYGVHVTGVTLSIEQVKYARARAQAEGLTDKVEFKLLDYREVSETFDRIVVVGMLEHVGQPQYGTFFGKIKQNLKQDGIAMVHVIGRSTPPGRTSPWLHKYIFPGGYTPALSEVSREIEKKRLVVTDVEVWRSHYARTVQHWIDRFEANLDPIRDMYDDRFLRMWRYYLIASEISLTELGMCIFQYQITHHPMAAPITRDYIYAQD
ncbi:class I SAM-dependent methyltransferase [Aestuariibius sp. HNIBRBA575]|uniref:class I SAM-dependent methyltransferase n=1 Tax=Aestuariibius sp. HNIBRBA575 TaxID=3233343 RepID=UPI0034A3CD6F